MCDSKLAFYTVWSKEDGEYVGLCDAFSSLSWLEPTEREALEGIENLVKEVLTDLQ